MIDVDDHLNENVLDRLLLALINHWRNESQQHLPSFIEIAGVKIGDDLAVASPHAIASGHRQPLFRSSDAIESRRINPFFSHGNKKKSNEKSRGDRNLDGHRIKKFEDVTRSIPILSEFT